MTTRVHVVNLGPSSVEVETIAEHNPGVEKKVVLYPGDSVNEYVYQQQQIKITEK